MKRFAIVLGACLLVSSASAAVRFFFTSSADGAGLADTTHVFDDTDGSGTDGKSYALNDNAPTVGIPTIDPSKGEFLYLWLAFEGEKNGRKIQGINIVANSEAYGGGVAELERGMYIGNDDGGPFGEPLRWNYSSKTLDAMTLAGVNVPGVKNQAENAFLYRGGSARYALLGAIAPGEGAYELRLGLGKNGVSYAKNSDDQRAPRVKFGGNEEEFDGGVKEESYWSSDADAVIVPEPAAGLILIAILAVGSRRR